MGPSKFFWMFSNKFIDQKKFFGGGGGGCQHLSLLKYFGTKIFKKILKFWPKLMIFQTVSKLTNVEQDIDIFEKKARYSRFVALRKF